MAPVSLGDSSVTSASPGVLVAGIVDPAFGAGAQPPLRIVSSSVSNSRLTDPIDPSYIVGGVAAYVTRLSLVRDGRIEFHTGSSSSEAGSGTGPQFVNFGNIYIVVFYSSTSARWDGGRLDDSDATEPFIFSAESVSAAGPTVNLTLINAINSDSTVKVLLVDSAHERIDINNLMLLDPPVSNPPAVPTDVTLAAVDTDSVRGTWPAVQDANTYQGQYKKSTDTTWTDISGDITSPHDIDGLDSGTAYDFRVRATNTAGSSGYSTAASASTTSPPTPLALADFVTPTGRQNVVAAVFTRADSNTWMWRLDQSLGSLIEGSFGTYTRIRNNSPTTWQINDTPNPITLNTFFASGGDGYDYHIHIQDDEGVASFPVQGTTVDGSGGHFFRWRPPTAFMTVVNRIAANERFIVAMTEPVPTPVTPAAPDAPTSPTATATSDTAISFTWVAPAGGSVVDSFEVEYKKSTETAWTAATDLTSPSVITGLDASTTYNVRVRSKNTGGTSAWVSDDATTQAAASTAPQNVVVTAVDHTELLVTWGAVTGAIRYTIQWRRSGTTSWAAQATTASRSHRLRNLSGLQSWDFRIQGITSDNTGLDWSAVVSGTTLIAPPAVPTGVTLTAIDTDTVRGTWNDVVGAATYQGQFKKSSDTTWIDISGDITSPQDIDGLDLGVSYDFRVRATNSSGSSAYSAADSATTESLQATPSYVGTLTVGKAELTLENPPDLSIEASPSYTGSLAVGTAELTLQDSPDLALEASPSYTGDLTVGKAELSILEIPSEELEAAPNYTGTLAVGKAELTLEIPDNLELEAAPSYTGALTATAELILETPDSLELEAAPNYTGALTTGTAELALEDPPDLALEASPSYTGVLTVGTAVLSQRDLPTVDFVDDVTVGIGTYFSHQFSESTRGAGNYIYSLVGALPKGLSYLSNTRTLSGRPSEKGVFELVFRSVDGANNINETDFTLTVDNIDSLHLFNYRFQVDWENRDGDWDSYITSTPATFDIATMIVSARVVRAATGSIILGAGAIASRAAGGDGIADLMIDTNLSIETIEWKPWQDNPLVLTRATGNTGSFLTEVANGQALDNRSLYLTASDETVELPIADAIADDDSLSWGWPFGEDERRVLGFVMDLDIGDDLDIRIDGPGKTGLVVGVDESDIYPDILEEFSLWRGRDFKVGYSIPLAGKGSLILRNDNNQYDDYIDGRELRPECRFQIQIDDEWITLWRGIVDDVRKLGDRFGYTTVEIQVLGILSNLVNTTVSTSLENDVEIKDAFENALGFAELDQKWIGDIESTRSMDTWWVLNEEVLDVMGVLERTEYGIVVENQEGKIVLQSADKRETTARQGGHAAFFSDQALDLNDGSFDIIEAEYEIPRWNIVNNIRILIRRYNTTVSAPLWSLADPIEILANDTVSIIVEHLAGVAVWDTPVAGTDYTVGVAATGNSGEEASITLITAARGGELLIDIQNNSNQNLWLQTLVVRGRALDDSASYHINEKDQDSIDQYGIRTYPAPETWHTDLVDARSYAQTLLSTLATPQKRINLTFNVNNARAKQLATLEISDVVNVHWEGLNQNLFVESVTHHVKRGFRHDMSLLLSSTDNYGTSLVFDDSNNGIIGTNTFGR